MSILPTRRHLSRLLAAASAPVEPGELDGEDMVLAAYQAARPVRSRRHTVLRAILARLASAKVAAACAAAAAAGAGGVAAATTAGLPVPFRSGPAASTSAQPARARVNMPPDRIAPLVSPSMLMDHKSRCREWTSKDRDERRSSLDDPVFRDLINRAGGRDSERVDRYCRDLLNGAPTPAPSERPSIWPTDQPDSGNGRGQRPSEPPDPQRGR